MKMELYNTTDKTKEIPKFNYEGKIAMKPHGKYDIEDYMAPFYKPYARVGIVVRPVAKMGTFSIKREEIEPEVKEVIKDTPEKLGEVVLKKTEPVVDIPVESEVVENVPVVEVETKTESELVEEKVVEETSSNSDKVYSKSDLTTLSIKSLRDIVKKLGLDVKSNKKSELIEEILKSQE